MGLSTVRQCGRGLKTFGLSGGTMTQQNCASIELGVLTPASTDAYVDLNIAIDPHDFSYDYSKLYYALGEGQEYSEQQVICFKLRWKNIPERVRLALPVEVRRTGYIRLRLDALPYTPGRSEASCAGLVDGTVDDELTRLAKLIVLKELVRKEVERSEAEGRVELPHYPESISLELTAGCNLTCSHCSSHGDHADHSMNNRRAAFGASLLEKLAHEAFPSLTLLNLVGRGEPMMVSEALWNKLAQMLNHYRVLLSCVTNGYFLTKRINETILPVIDTLTVSIDGTTEDVFASNRGGASLAVVLKNIEHFQRLRNELNIARRPRLGFSWTLKKNNIHQFPDFVRLALSFDVQLLYVRHLFVFRDKDRFESLINSPDLVNQYLQQAYDLIAGTRMKLDVPPLAKSMS